MAEANTSTKELMEALTAANSAIEDMSILFLGVNQAAGEVIDKISCDYAWMGTAIKSMSGEGQRIADECTQKYLSLHRARAEA